MHTGKSTKTAASEAVVITGFGLLTPIGQSFWHSMLSLRAKRSCYQQHETVLVADSRYGEILRGAAISRVANRIIPRSLSAADRISALLLPSIAECLDGLSLELRQSMTWQLITRHAGSEEAFRISIAEKLPEANFSPGSFCQSGAVRGYFFAGIADAAELLLANRAERVLVACADSLCDTPQLEELLYAGLLKDATNPYGLMAGEAAGAVLLERESTACTRGAPIMARIAAWGRGREPNPWPAGSPSTGQGLTAAFHDAFSRLADGGASVGQVITDENGERPRALEWALTAGRIFPNNEKVRLLRHPAVMTGDAGGALAAVLLADGLAQMAWHRPPVGRIALAVSDDQEDRRVLCVEPGDRRARRSYFKAVRQRLGCERKNVEV